MMKLRVGRLSLAMVIILSFLISPSWTAAQEAAAPAESAAESAVKSESGTSAGPAYKPRTVLPRPIRPIEDPVVVKGDLANIAGNELIIGVEVDGQARAYPINQLHGPSREIINDELGGKAIAATW